jgi:hypothetical protein
MSMPRRVPVPVQSPASQLPPAPAHGSYSDPALGQQHRGFGLSAGDDDEEEDAGGIIVDVVPTSEEKAYKVLGMKPGGKGGEGSGRRRKTGQTRRRN